MNQRVNPTQITIFDCPYFYTLTFCTAASTWSSSSSTSDPSSLSNSSPSFPSRAPSLSLSPLSPGRRLPMTASSVTQPVVKLRQVFLKKNFSICRASCSSGFIRFWCLVSVSKVDEKRCSDGTEVACCQEWVSNSTKWQIG